MLGRPMVCVLFLPLITLLAVSPASAQGPGTGPGGPPPGGPHGGPPGGRRGPDFDILALEGPLTPAAFTTVTGATTGQEAEYGKLYAAWLGDTKAARDSLDLAQQNIRAALDHGRREALPPLFAQLNGNGATLDRKLKSFDAEVKKLLPKDQWKKYEKDEKARRKALEQEQKEMMPGGGPGGHGGPR